jgi:hypothetical protein
MESASHLWELYEEWKRLTLAEGAAISVSDWPQVRRCQSAKKELQSRIIRCTEITKGACASPLEQEQIDTHVRSFVNELIVLETQNNSILQARLENLARERSEIDRTASRLRQVHKSYVPPRQPIWNRYS